MNRIVVTGAESWQVAPVEEVDPGPGEVKLGLVSAGICGGDLALLAGANAVASYPLVLGHECVGRVEATGPDTDIDEGRHVVVYPTISCMSCDACDARRTNQCPDMRVMGLSDPNGCFADSLVTRAEQCVVLPDEVALTYGALVEPVAVASHVLDRAQMGAGDSILIIGSGSIGLTLAVVARERGTGDIGLVDRFASRRAAANALGFERFAVTGDGDPVAWARRELGPIDLVLDTVVVDDTARLATEVLRPGGHYVMVASSKHQQQVAIRYDHFFLKELTAVATRNYTRDDFSSAVELLDTRRPDLDGLVTATYPLNEIAHALEDLRERPQEHLKVLLGPSGNDG